MDAVRRMMDRDRFAARCGIRLEQVREGHARATMDAGADHLNGVDIVQGGAIFTLADFAFAAAANAVGAAAVAVGASVQFVRAARPGRLVAEAEEVARSSRISTVAVRVIDGAGELVALFQGTAYRSSRRADGGR
jgi:acyl-CoA thioesterase